MPSARALSRGSSGSPAWAETNGARQITMTRISSGIVRRVLSLDLMARSDMGDGDLNLGLFRLNGSGQRESLLFFTMDEKNLTWAWPDCPHVGQEVLVIRMGREPVELDDLGPARSGHAENRDDIPPFDKFVPEGMLGLKAHKEITFASS